MTQDRRRFDGTCKNRHEIILAYLWEEERWVAAPELIKLELPYGITGSSGDVRARELARNECAEKVKGRVERAEGRDIGLDKRFTYYRHVPQDRVLTHQEILEANARNVAAF